MVQFLQTFFCLLPCPRNLTKRIIYHMFDHTASVSPVTSTPSTVITPRSLFFCLVIICKSYMKEAKGSFSDAAIFAISQNITHFWMSIDTVLDFTFSTVLIHLTNMFQEIKCTPLPVLAISFIIVSTFSFFMGSHSILSNGILLGLFTIFY